MRHLALCAVALAALAAPVAAQPAASRPAPPPPPGPRAPTFQVKGIHAFLYFHKTGGFGDRDLTDGQTALWNTIIGEGDAGLPATSMLVKVEVGGPNFASAPGKLTVVAKAGKKTLAKQTFTLGDYFDEGGQTITLPMLVTGVGCDAVTLTATLAGKGVRGAATATVPFACGE